MFKMAAALAAVAPRIFLVLQMLVALVLIITGIDDQVGADNQPNYLFFPLSYIVMPIWTGVLIEITAACGLVVKTKMHHARNSFLALVYHPLNITCAILSGYLLFQYGKERILVTTARNQALRKNGDGFYYFSDDPEEDNNLSNLTTIYFTALSELFLFILGTVVFQDRSSNTQLGSFQT